MQLFHGAAVPYHPQIEGTYNSSIELEPWIPSCIRGDSVQSYANSGINIYVFACEIWHYKFFATFHANRFIKTPAEHVRHPKTSRKERIFFNFSVKVSVTFAITFKFLLLMLLLLKLFLILMLGFSVTFKSSVAFAVTVK